MEIRDGGTKAKEEKRKEERKQSVKESHRCLFNFNFDFLKRDRSSFRKVGKGFYFVS
jgi:hypothetical protein